jgi:hypothetical protein
MIYKHAVFQFGIGLLLLSLFAATDTWYLITGFDIARALNAIIAVIAGAGITTIIHEWAHYAGARFAGARHTIPGRYGLFVYDFDYEDNSLAQFNTMSLVGQLGSWLSVWLLWQSVPMDTAGRVMLVAGAVTSAVFAGMVELPVLKRAQATGEPLKELEKIDDRVLRRSALVGITGGLLFWYLAT